MLQETLDLMEDQIKENLKTIQGIDDVNSEKRKMLVKETIMISEKLISAEHDLFEYGDKEDRRRLEREKNETMEKLEKEKQDLNWKKMAIEIGKIIVPAGMLLTQIAAYDKFQKRMFEFEENGRIVSSGGRELHLPKFWK